MSTLISVCTSIEIISSGTLIISLKMREKIKPQENFLKIFFHLLMKIKQGKKFLYLSFDPRSKKTQWILFFLIRHWDDSDLFLKSCVSLLLLSLCMFNASLLNLIISKREAEIMFNSSDNSTFNVHILSN